MNPRRPAGVAFLTALCACLLPGQTPTAALAGRVQELLAKGDIAAARAELAAAARGGADATVYNLTGVVEAQAGNYRAAEAAFRSAIKLAPQAVPIYQNLGRLYQEHAAEDAKAMEKAVQTYRTLLRIDPADREGNFQLARLLAFEGAYTESEARLRKLPAEALGQPGALATLCVDQAGTGRRELARKTAAALVAHTEVAEADVTSILPALERAKAPEIAQMLLEGLAARGLASPAALAPLARLYESRGALADARKTFEALAQRTGVTVPGLLDLARVSFKQRDFEGTLGYLAHARDLEPRNAGVHFFFAIASIELSLPVEAEKSLQQALALDGSNPYYHYAMGAVALQLKKTEDAIAAFRKYCEAKPDDVRGRLALGVAYYFAQQDPLASEELTRAAARPETAAGANYFLGRIAVRQGEFERAATLLRQAIKENPKHADAYAELGFVLVSEKQIEDAQQTLARALELDPQNYRANFALLTLYRRQRDPRAAEQEKKFNQLRQKQFESLQFLMRTVEARPY